MTMKKIALLLSVLFFTLFSCTKDLEQLVTFNFNDSAEIVIKSGLGVNTPISIPTPNIKSSSRSAFESNNTRVDLVKNVKLTRLVLTMDKPNNASFDLLKSIKIYIIAEGLEKKLIAHKTDIPTNVGKTLELETTEDNLDDYIKSESYGIETEVVTRKQYLSDLHIIADMGFRVTADIF
jgi:hypothetical protein